MTEAYEEVRRAAFALSEADRPTLAHDLLGSIETRHDGRHEAAWDAEVRSRFDDIVEGRVETIPHAEVRARLAADREERRR
ncbi:MAG: addiction module protein [Nocardioidaceae bacterium]|nr:addiction module protein [Nocardioidaceae bacterium]MCL2613969.1 addiction module protein [Nocardioidaceae bacterium]